MRYCVRIAGVVAALVGGCGGASPPPAEPAGASFPSDVVYRGRRTGVDAPALGGDIGGANAVPVRPELARDAAASSRIALSLRDEQVSVAAVDAVVPLVRRAAARWGVPQSLVMGVIWVESRFDPEARSPVGALGLMQLMPKTARYLARCIGWEGAADPLDPEFNVTAGTYYLARLYRQFGSWEYALAAYNAGPGNVDRWLRAGRLPRVSVAYYSMVLTAQAHFSDAEPTEKDLDQLGLAVLVAEVSREQWDALRADSDDPFGGL